MSWNGSVLGYSLLRSAGDGLPPGTPPTREFKGPWLSTQLSLAGTIGLFSFLVFCYCQTRWPLLYAPRTKLKGFSPHDAHAHTSFSAWILPTIRTSEFTVLQTVGLDAAVLLNFLKMSFQLFTVASLLALCILMPINYHNNIGFDDDDDDKNGDDNDNPSYARLFRLLPSPPKQGVPGDDWIGRLNDANSIQTLHLLFTYVFTILTLRFIHRAYQSFIQSRQIFCLQLAHSVPARTVMITDLPEHLRGERALAEFFENMELGVESVSLVREYGALGELIGKRTDALLSLEAAWTNYVGNPSAVEAYDPSVDIRSDPITGGYHGEDVGDEEAQRTRLVVPHRPRPTIRSTCFSRKRDALEYIEQRFQAADEAVRRKRRSAKLKATPVAFVTFETMSSAQVAAQAVTLAGKISLAPEPRDVVWQNIYIPSFSYFTRRVTVYAFVTVLFLFWVVPVTTLSTLLNYEEIQKVAPWLGEIIDKSPSIQSLVQTTLPSTAVIVLNGLLPFFLEATSYIQGERARSLVEYSLLKKYFLFLLINVVFIFLFTTTYLALIQDLANSPAQVPKKIARALRKSDAKRFFVSYVVFQGLAIMPLQLLNLGTIIPRVFYRIFWTRTPRDFAELNAPPMINYGAVYPPAILIFVVSLMYSVIQPLILIFGAIYFGVAYVVYKYKLLFVFYKPYESKGEAWPITFARLMWGIVLFQVFMMGILTLSKSIILASLMLPLLVGTAYWGWRMHRECRPFTEFVELDKVFEAQRSGADAMTRTQGEHITASHTHLSRMRYSQNDETLYVAPEDSRTDYSQPPMTNFYYGVLNTGKRRYGHPALDGLLPQPWLPLKKGQTLANFIDRDDGEAANGASGKNSDNHTQAVVLTLRRRYNTIRKDVRDIAGRLIRKDKHPGQEERLPTPEVAMTEAGRESPSGPSKPPSVANSNPWHDTISGSSHQTLQARTRRLSFDPATGIINLPDDDGDWIEGSGLGDSDSEREGGSPSGEVEGGESSGRTAHRRRSVYWHHPEKRRVSGNFNQTGQ
ncbi:uncharacterized protein EI90DRAFT_3281600 [Cantharellus anzutake]|uniref:uncharacterized protein n=1 Tax=Cantharellus anzutake TaxID=1750568 RepID=UPI001903100C|nr:uncharacterized protein EI90DRAFT_3281600 [Cantharellus anzutake]KAF8326836.1 hypothetical protein EI90DRAFT_3281600 [Cantharellus anzutake]